jgi:hypothetical protein
MWSLHTPLHIRCAAYISRIYLNNSNSRDVDVAICKIASVKNNWLGTCTESAGVWLQWVLMKYFEDPRLGFSQFNWIIAWESPWLSFRRCDCDIFFAGVHRVRGETTLTSSMSVSPPVSVRRYSLLRNTQEFGKRKYLFTFLNTGSVITEHVAIFVVCVCFVLIWSQLYAMSLLRLKMLYRGDELHIVKRVISGFRREAAENCALLGC